MTDKKIQEFMKARETARNSCRFMYGRRPSRPTGAGALMDKDVEVAARTLKSDIANRRPIADTVVWWMGGGYDGCIQEPNVGFFDRDGKWRPVISTGVGGADKRWDIMRIIEVVEHDEFFHAFRCSTPEEAQAAVVQSQYLVREDFVLRLCLALGEYFAEYHESVPGMACSVCGEIGPVSDGCSYDFLNSRGDGGVGTVLDGFVCEDCLCGQHTCLECDGGELLDGTEFTGVRMSGNRFNPRYPISIGETALSTLFYDNVCDDCITGWLGGQDLFGVSLDEDAVEEYTREMDWIGESLQGFRPRLLRLRHTLGRDGLRARYAEQCEFFRGSIVHAVGRLLDSVPEGKRAVLMERAHPDRLDGLLRF